MVRVTLPRIRLVEVGPRDGLQNERSILSASLKIQLIQRLVQAGLRNVESGAFVSPRWVPQMATTPEVISSSLLRDLRERYGDSLSLPVLVPNMQGLQALSKILFETDQMRKGQIPVTNEISIFISATESFSQANLNCSITESLARLKPVVAQALAQGIKVRGYISVVIGCPFEGQVDPAQVAKVVEALDRMGCYEISLGDTIGTGTPTSFNRLIKILKERVEVKKLAAHCHDSFGTGIANVLSLIDEGIRTVDCSIAGLGGCPYSPGASGNISTEDLVYALESSGYPTGILPPPCPPLDPTGLEIWDDLLVPGSERGIAFEELVKVGEWISNSLGRNNSSKAGIAMLARLALRQQKTSSLNKGVGKDLASGL